MGTLPAKLNQKMATNPPKLRVLCFGDSLTAGYSAWGAIHHPYQEMLEQILSMAYPDLKVDTLEDGLSGAMVKTDFQTRMHSHCTYTGMTGGLVGLWMDCFADAWVGVVM